MYQWRKFEFFEEKLSGKCKVLPDEATSEVTCCSTGRGKVVIGCDDGTVSLLDRGLKFNYKFQAHSSSVLFLQQLKQRNFLLTIGEEEQVSPQLSAMCLKVFDLDKMQSEGSSTSGPDCIQILRIFTNQFPEAKITSFIVLEEAPPILLIAIGLDNGCIYCIKGDIARERITRFKLQVESANKDQSSITGLGFRMDGSALLLFAVTPSSVHLFSLQNQPPKQQTLDHIGCNANNVAMSDRSELIIGRPEAVFFYEVDGRGPCWAFEGEKKIIGWFRGYLLCVIADQRKGKNTFNIYDLKNHLIAHSIVVTEVSHMLCEWGSIILIMSDKSALCIGEKDMESKLDMLFKKNLYTVAINLVQSQQADAAATAEVLRKYGDHLYSKQEYDAAMNQYINTIGHLEPSFVIQKFLDAQRISNLTNYLEKLHEKGLASKDHTTLLLNCYTKLKDVEKLNVFIKSEDSVGEHKFDVETAIREETLVMRKEIQDLRTNARIFQLSKCTACTFTLDLPAVHFMCMHSFHQRCLGDNEKECPVCAPEYRSVLEIKRSLEQNAKDQDRFFRQVRSSKDGFSVIAEYFGKGVISKTRNGQTDVVGSEDAASSSGF